ncbi:Endoribonuclease YbeY [Candidatus Xenohaliotis californiensis]|uniref:Endoribonuclease YbeY n=1 Tax=Candidatus Xenohaliotis californiensis TaxID=84677 RepID=A0ABM9N8T9_9RICK|nr:Endoribonuclease YbeY [Candidatus Xenohaliotis californiensis]
MSLEYDVYIHDKRWNSVLKNNHVLYQLAYNIDLTLNTFDNEYTVSLNFVNDTSIQLLNKEYHNKDSPTNVLSLLYFSDTNSARAKEPLGDVFVSFDTITAEAKIFKVDFHNHFMHMLLHGTLHILGFDHVNNSDAKIMEDIESTIMTNMLGIDPYKTHML